jgi:hypothetical protein
MARQHTNRDVRVVDTAACAVIGWKRFHEGELEG